MINEFLDKVIEYSLVGISTYLVFINKKLSQHDNEISLLKKDIKTLNEYSKDFQCLKYILKQKEDTEKNEIQL